MAHEAEVRDELGRLLARLPDATGVLASTVDGLLIAHEAPDTPAETLAALSSAGFGIGLRLSDAAGGHSFRELLVRGEHGYVALYAAGPACVLTVLAGPRINVGRLHMEARRSSAYLAHLLDGAADDREDA
ncbi:roadblock/LC7 domain-containing protein [Streptomyces sp. NBC_00669]|uniref:roadblock/LC7 domain-containing protein n=1 Tax=unclassified Streptomyces TaxID=2593676 RepID=UPI002E3712F3|nr:roadblock/LC7 domain-containing protein [Streptomyces sp. NBC_00669]